MKRFTSLFLAVAIIFSFAACAKITPDIEETTLSDIEKCESESKTEIISDETTEAWEPEESVNGVIEESDTGYVESYVLEMETVEVGGISGSTEGLPYVDFVRVDHTGEYGGLFSTFADNDPDIENGEEPIIVIENIARYNRLSGLLAMSGFSVATNYFNGVGLFDESFFESYALVIAYIVEGSGSITHELYSCGMAETENGRELVMSIVKKIPQCGTCDMAGWFMVAGVPKSMVSGCSDYRIEYVEPTFTDAQATFALDLFKAVNSADKGENILISPLSVTIALAMAANGATEYSETCHEILEMISQGKTREQFNKELASYLIDLPSKEGQKLLVSNSIWHRDTDRMTVKDEFLQTNREYYGAIAYKEPFDNATVEKINSWVNNATDGMIDKMLYAPIDEDDLIYIINAICFDAKWMAQYSEYKVKDGRFTADDGTVREVKMMSSTEFLYVEDAYATGFLKQYEGARYAFAALLPNEDISIDDYIASLDGRRLAYMLANANNAIVEAKIPKFKTEYDIEMSLILKAMGLDNVFAGEYTNFGEMAEMHDGTPLAIGNVLHKTYIEVIESGTRAAAVTVASMAPGAAPGEIKSVTLDRPFVYAIVDTETGLPIFIGALRDITE